jgi:hypothetical protein
MSRYRPDPLMRGGALGDADARRLRKLAGGSAMSGGTPAVSLTRSFTDLLSAWSSDDPALLDQSVCCCWMVLPWRWPALESADRALWRHKPGLNLPTVRRP